jgi:hypothetical protein
MRRVSVIRRVTALLVMISVFAGANGLVLTSHICIHCGTNERAVTLFGHLADYHRNCQSESESNCYAREQYATDTQESCCGEADGSDNSEGTNVADVLDITGLTDIAEGSMVSDETCCKSETKIISIDTLRDEKPARIMADSQPASLRAVDEVHYRTVSADKNLKPDNRYSGRRNIAELTCCLLI